MNGVHSESAYMSLLCVVMASIAAGLLLKVHVVSEEWASFGVLL